MPAIVVVYTLVATQVGSTMFYVLNSTNPLYPLTCSFNIPVNPTPDMVDAGFGFTINANHIGDFLVNGVPSTDLLVFYNIADDGAFAAFINSITSDFSMNGPQLYSGAEATPTMLAGTFELTQTFTASVNNYTALITSEHNKRPNFVAFVMAITQASVDQQNQLAQFPVLFDIDQAVGDQLDKLGQWIGVSRDLPIEVMGTSVLDDAQYVILLKLFIAQNQWDGTVPGIYNAWNAVFTQEGYMILIQDNQDMTMFIVFLNPPTDPVVLAILTEGYFLMRPAGVRITGYYEPSLPFPGTPVFGWGVENATISGWGVGAWVEPIVP